jgi:hypothetical protein
MYDITQSIMPTYFGLPLNLDEIIRILNISSLIENYFELLTRQPTSNEINHIKYSQIKKYIKSCTKLDLFMTDKGQYILGYEIKYIRDVWNNFTSADKLIEILKQLKDDFEEDIIILNADLFHVELERMENDNIYVNYPKPCVIQWEYC